MSNKISLKEVEKAVIAKHVDLFYNDSPDFDSRQGFCIDPTCACHVLKLANDLQALLREALPWVADVYGPTAERFDLADRIREALGGDNG